MLAPVLACRYVAGRVRAAAGRRWLEGLRHPSLPCRSTVPEVRLFAERRLRGVPEPAARALVGWGDGLYDGELRFDVPAPADVLALLARGRRCVSLLNRADGLAFALHDLCHLERFYEPSWRAGQIGFFARLEAATLDSRWPALIAHLDAEWEQEFEHVMCDMNASSVFLWCGLRSRLEKACRRAGHPFAPRLALLVELVAPTDDARAVRSRRSPIEASRRLDAFFAAAAAERIPLPM